MRVDHTAADGRVARPDRVPGVRPGKEPFAAPLDRGPGAVTYNGDTFALGTWWRAEVGNSILG